MEYKWFSLGFFIHLDAYGFVATRVTMYSPSWLVNERKHQRGIPVATVFRLDWN